MRSLLSLYHSYTLLEPMMHILYMVPLLEPMMHDQAAGQSGSHWWGIPVLWAFRSDASLQDPGEFSNVVFGAVG